MAAKLILIIAILMAAAVSRALSRSWWERRQLRVERYRLPSADAVQSRRMPGKRLVFLSDLHDYCRDYGSEDILRRIREAQPDLVLLGGDMITCQKSAGWTAETGPALGFICALAREYTVIYAEGNHETRFRSLHPEAFSAYRKALEDAGVICLIDGSVRTEGLAVWGITLDERFYRHLAPGFGRKEPMEADRILRQLGMPARDCFNILLMHSPLYLEEAASWGADLVLSGHFHGGTIRLPLPGRPGLMTPQYQFFVKECSGLHISRDGRCEMIVSRGLGTHTINLRLNDLPEISVIEPAGDDPADDRS